MEDQKKSGPTISIENLNDGDTLLWRVRKAHKEANDPDAGYKPSLEIAEFIENEARPVSAVAEMNDDDDRFAQRKPQHAFQPVSLKHAIANGWITQAQFDKLEPSKGVEAEKQEEGVHFVTVNVLNPKFNGKRLRVQILETTETNRKGVRAKINPRTGQSVLYKGKPIYRIAQVAYEGNHASNFLPSDNTTALFGKEMPAVTKETVNLND